jgi:hypothetical protein
MSSHNTISILFILCIFKSLSDFQGVTTCEKLAGSLLIGKYLHSQTRNKMTGGYVNKGGISFQ